ncbi:MAG: TolB family protein [Tepidisphaerales bacterium]
MREIPTIAYLAEGKLYLKDAAAAGQLIESDFARGILERLERDRGRHDWKQEGMAWNFGRGFGAMGPSAPPPEVRRIRISGLARSARAGHLLYALDTDYVGGLFEYELAGGYERRLFHRNQFRATDLASRAADGRIAMSLQSDADTAHIAVIGSEGKGLQQITEGDCVDESPAWSLAQASVLVYQSAGVGRDERGFRRELGPYAIHCLDLDKGDMKVAAESAAHDLMSPRVGPDGSMYCIRRPYEPRPPVSKRKLVLDVVLFPFRVVRAIVHFLNVFSIFFAKRPLMTAGGPDREGPDQRFVMLWGRMVEARKAAKAATGDAAELVSKDWELVKQTPDGSTQVLARAVVHYDLLPDGRLLYTTGGRVMLLDGTETTEVARGAMIERVAGVVR